jgi:UDP-N-acetylmuramyl-tripeptide synthetase
MGAPVAKDRDIAGLTADSREVAPGWLFAAMPGTKVDGRAFIPDAVAKGAAAVLAASGTTLVEPVSDTELVTDDNPRRRFSMMAAKFFDAQPATVAAVTGTNGKTSVANFARQIWERLGHKSASLGTLGVIAPGWDNKGGLTTPDPVSLHRTLAELAGLGITHAALEASSHGLSQYRLDGVTVSAAAFTNLTRDHLDYHADMEDYAAAKLRLFTEVVQEGGAAVVNADCSMGARLAAAARARSLKVVGFGQHIESEARLLDCALDPTSSTVFALINETAFAYKLGVPGLHWVMNSMGVLLAVNAAGGDKLKASAALADMAPPKGRGQRHTVRPSGKGGFVLIDESYNASPVSMRAAIATLATAKPGKRGRRIAVLGDMLELGEQSTQLHASLAEPLGRRAIDLVFTAGPLMTALQERLPKSQRGGHAASSDELAPLVCAQVRDGDVVMVKGSAGSRMGRVVQALLAMADAPKRAANGD